MIQLIIVLLIATGCYLLVKIYYLIDKLETKALESITKSGYNKLKQKKIMENEKWIPKIGDYAVCIYDNNTAVALNEVFKITGFKNGDLDKPQSAKSSSTGWVSKFRKALPHEIPKEVPKIDLSNLTKGEIYHGKSLNQPWEYIVKVLSDNKIGSGNQAILVHENKYNNSFGYLSPDSKWEFVKIAEPENKKWLNACIAANKFIPKEEALNPVTEFKVGDWVKRIKDSWHGKKVGDISQIYQLDKDGLRFEKNGAIHSSKSYILATPEEIAKVTGKKENDFYQERGYDIYGKWIPKVGELVSFYSGTQGKTITSKLKDWTSHSYCILESGDEPFKHLITKPVEQPMNTYGLKVGDKILSKIGDAWGIRGNWFNSGTWQKWKGWSSDRTIEKFQKTPDGITICTLSNCALGVHGLKAEGFKEFMDNFDKPKFEVGKWYKTRLGSYVRYKRTDVTTFISSENIMYDTKAYENREGKFGSIDYDKFTLLTDLSEIQEYLPNGHSDKIVQPKSLVGRYLKALVNQAQCIGICKAVDYFLIETQFDIKAKDGSRWGFGINDGNGKDKYWELMPEGFIPPVKSEIPDYVEIIDTGCHIDSNVVKGRIYRLLPDHKKTYYFGFLLDGKEKVGCGKDEFKHYFKPSTKEAYDAQFVQKQPIPPETLPNAKQFVEWVECIEDCCPIKKGDICKVSSNGTIESIRYEQMHCKHSWTASGSSRYFKPCNPPNMKEEDWCVLRTEENTGSIIKFFKDKYDYPYSGNGTYYGEKSSEINKRECSGTPWGKLLTTAEFYQKIGKTPGKQESNNPFNIGDKVLYRNREVTILGFNKDQKSVVIEGILDGHSGDMLDYWYDKKGNKIPYYSSGKMDRYYISINNLKPISSGKSLIDQAREKYPVGTKFISPHNNKQYTVVKHPYNGDGFYLDDKGKNVLCHVNGYCGDYVYYEGKWAEIVSKPEKENKAFIKGDIVVVLDSGWNNSNHLWYPKNYTSTIRQGQILQVLDVDYSARYGNGYTVKIGNSAYGSEKLRYATSSEVAAFYGTTGEIPGNLEPFYGAKLVEELVEFSNNYKQRKKGWIDPSVQTVKPVNVQLVQTKKVVYF